MNLQLMEMRKAAGYTNRDDFAREHGIKLSTYKSYESGRIKLTLDKACELANIFGCTLDDLAGRKPPYDRQKAMLIRDYDQLSEAGQDAAAGAVRGILASEVARGIESDVDDNMRERRDA